MNTGFLKVSTISPNLNVCNVTYNCKEIIKQLDKLNNNVQIAVLPELSLCGYTCNDLFYKKVLLDACYDGIIKICNYSKSFDGLIVVGSPIQYDNYLYNCAVVIFNGKIVGIVPKTYLSNKKDGLWFNSGRNIKKDTYLGCFGYDVPFGTDLIIKINNETRIGIEIGDDIFAPCPPSNDLALNGANIIINLSATEKLIERNEYIKDLISNQSARLNCSYIFSSSGPCESTTDNVFSGLCIIAENGKILDFNSEITFNSKVSTSDIDIEKINAIRLDNQLFKTTNLFKTINLPSIIQYENEKNIDREFDRFPFVPQDNEELFEKCEDALQIQSFGLAKRMKYIGAKKIVLGISGGLDSTLALIVAVRSMKILNLPLKDLICITMPGFGTTDRTYQNACKLVELYGASLKEISIKDACIQHFKDIDHNMNIHDVTYENTQARERTQILMDYANKINGILVGTGDLSELALGWCTFNGDQMSMYGVNGSVPKTLVKAIVSYEAKNVQGEIGEILQSVIDTPVSPELLPPDKNGKIEQKTENVLCPYEVCDFYLYNFIKYGFSNKKLLFMAEKAFENTYTKEELTKWLKLFIKRFFISQFKRSSMPDGASIGSISFSPRNSFKMVSDASFEDFI